MVRVNGWTLFQHPEFSRQLIKLKAKVLAAKAADPGGYRRSQDFKLFSAVMKLIDEVIPATLPDTKDFRHGGTLAGDRKHWFRAKFGNGRYRLFFQFSSTEKAIIYAWVNDEETLRTYGSKTDAYAVFAAMLANGNPPDTWEDLMNAVGAEVGVVELDAIGARPKDRGGKRKR